MCMKQWTTKLLFSKHFVTIELESYISLHGSHGSGLSEPRDAYRTSRCLTFDFDPRFVLSEEEYLFVIVL
jgi:hypothetical protein